MANSFHCRCGERLPLPTTADEVVDCPACGRSIMRDAGDGRGIRVALAVAAACALVAVGLLGLLLERGRSLPVAAVVPEPLPAIVPAPPPREVVVEPDPLPLPVPMVEPDPIPPPMPVEPPPAPKPRAGLLEATIDPAGRYKLGETIRQEVTFSRRTAYQIAGADIVDAARYSLASSLVVTKVNDDGSFSVEQTVVAAKLLEADAGVKATLTAALKKAEGTKFQLAISKHGEVTALDGLKDSIRVENGRNGVQPTVRVWSLLDADAWKELAGLTFFQPGQALKLKATWTKSMSHDMGPFGSFQGKTVFLATGKPAKTSLERVDYRHDLIHKAAANGADRDLPFRISHAQFQTPAAAGAILYDPATNRATMADELFRVRGTVSVALLDTNVAIVLEEQQGFRLVIGESKEQELVGQPPKRGK